MNRDLNPFDVVLLGGLFLLVDLRRTGLDLLPNVLGFAFLLAGALLLRQSATGREERWLLEATLGVSAVGVLTSFPFLTAAGVRGYVTPSELPLTLDAGLLWMSLACIGLANGLLLLALRARVKRLGGNERFERASLWAAVANLTIPFLALGAEIVLRDALAPWGARGALGLTLVLLGALLAILLYWEARVLGRGPRSGPQAVSVTEDPRRSAPRR